VVWQGRSHLAVPYADRACAAKAAAESREETASEGLGSVPRNPRFNSRPSVAENNERLSEFTRRENMRFELIIAVVIKTNRLFSRWFCPVYKRFIEKGRRHDRFKY
jgi:hypothetical protein